MSIVNLTPHALNIHLSKDEGDLITVEPSGEVARVTQTRVPMPPIGEIPVTKSIFGEVENLPDPQPNTIYVVSGLVLSQVDSRDDVFGVGELIRNDKGQVIGCYGLSSS